MSNKTFQGREEYTDDETKVGFKPEEREKLLASRGWVSVEGADYLAWSPGLVIQGRFKGLQDGNEEFEGKLMLIETQRGPVLVAFSGVLKHRLPGLAPGDEVYIRALGRTIETKNGKAWNFKVMHKPNQEKLPI